MNKILDRLKGKSIGIRIEDLDDETIAYLDDSNTRTHYINRDKEPKVSNLLGHFSTYSYLIWNIQADNWFLSNSLSNFEGQKSTILSPEEFRTAIGMVVERPTYEYISFPDAFNYSDVEVIVNHFGYKFYNYDGGPSVKTWLEDSKHLKAFGKPIGIVVGHKDKDIARVVNLSPFDPIPLYDYLKALPQKEAKAPSHDLKTMESTLSYTKQDLTWELLQTLDHSKTYKIFIDGEEGFLRRDAHFGTKEVYWFLHYDYCKVSGAICVDKLKKYSWSLKQESYLTDLYSNRGVKSLTIDLGSTEKSQDKPKQEDSKEMIVDEPLTFEKFQELPDGQRLIVHYPGDVRIEVVKKSFKSRLYLCSNDSRFGREKIVGHLDELCEELHNWSKVWNLGNRYGDDSSFKCIRLNSSSEVPVKIYLNGESVKLSDHVPSTSAALGKPIKDSDSYFVVGKSSGLFTVPDSGTYRIGDSLYSLSKGMEIDLDATKKSGRLSIHLGKPCGEVSKPEDIKFKAPEPTPDYIFSINNKLGIFTVPESGYYNINGKLMYLPYRAEVDLSKVGLKAEDDIEKLREAINVSTRIPKEYLLPRMNRWVIPPGLTYTNGKRVDSVEESYLDKIKRRFKHMFETKTKVSQLTLKTIHPDVLPEIGELICREIGANYKEKDGKIFLMKGAIIPMELTVERVTKLLVSRIEGKVWNEVKDSKAMSVINRLKLVKRITFENAEESLEDLF